MVGIGGLVERAVRPLKRRVRLMIGRAVLQLVDDKRYPLERRFQAMQIKGHASETLDGVERIQNYGITSVPHPRAECVVAAVGGVRQHSLVIAVDDRRYRVTRLAPGEVCIYTDEDGDAGAHRIHLKRGKVTEIRADAVKIISGSLTHNGVNIGETHVHGGVASGPGDTEVPH